jgi:hypothetical protein
MWWELRRALFNVAVVISGAAFFVVIELITGRYVEFGQAANEPVLLWLGGACFIIAANACYTIGGIFESIWRERDPSRIDAIRTSVHRRGTMLSLAVAVTPGAVTLMAGLLFALR